MTAFYNMNVTHLYLLTDSFTNNEFPVNCCEDLKVGLHPNPNPNPRNYDEIE